MTPPTPCVPNRKYPNKVSKRECSNTLYPRYEMDAPKTTGYKTGRVLDSFKNHKKSNIQKV